jgi:carboxyl-terminal processing protease
VATLLLVQTALSQAPGVASDGSSAAVSAPAGGQTGEQKLESARAALHGQHKDTVKAKELLLGIIEKDKATLQPGSLCYVYVYLGYIADLATNRTQAIAWYKRALALKDGDMILGCAQQGLKEPMTWIRHLDEDAAPKRQAASPAASTNAAPADARLDPKVKFDADDANTKLQQAREALHGAPKDEARARKLLLEIVEQHKDALEATDLCHAYVYLGYIEDRAGNRDQAIPWYHKALDVKEANQWIRECASYGLKRPLTWIRHLDEGTASPSASKPPVKTLDLGKAYVTTEQPPAGLVPAKELSPAERQENFDLLWEAIDQTYADFELKAINWPEVKQRYQARLDQAATTDAFYFLLFQVVAELKDTHSWLQNYSPPRPMHGPGLSVGLIEERPFVKAVEPDSEAAGMGVKPGAEIVQVDGLAVEEKLARVRPYVPGRSSERAFRREACRYLLAGEKGTTVAVRLRASDGRTTNTFALKRSFGLGHRAALVCPPDLTRQRFVHFSRHPSGLGYIRIESFNGRGEVDAEFDRALEALRNTRGLILDIRDNEGGFGHPRIVGRLLQQSALVAVSYRKNGPGHNDLQRREERLEPSGPWQYTGQVALLVNDVTGSAADLFACWLRSAGRVVTIGSTTHGNLSGVAAFAVLPCGLVVRISNGYMCDAKDQAIEGQGNEPDVRISPTIAEVLNGKDPVLDKAVSLLGDR